MKNKFLYTVSAFALITFLPAHAETRVDADIKPPIEQTMKDSMAEARDKVREGYHDIKASLLNEDASKTDTTQITVNTRNTASGIIGQPVLNAKNERVGKIHDVILDENGNAQMVVVADGDILGLGKLAAFNYSSVVQMNAEGQIVAPLTEETINQAAEFTYEREDVGPNMKMIPANGYSVAALLKADVIDTQKEKLGDVDDVVMKGGRADQLIIGFDKVLGLGGEKAAVGYKTAAVVKDGNDYDFQLSGASATQFENYKNSLKP